LDLERSALRSKHQEMLDLIEVRHVKPSTWKDITLPVMRRLVGRLIPDLLANGEATLVTEPAPT
jgi:hypothetical protein